MGLGILSFAAKHSNVDLDNENLKFKYEFLFSFFLVSAEKNYQQRNQ